MPKKRSSKVSTVTKNAPDAGQEKPPSTSEGTTKELDVDEIFASLKRKRAEKEKAEKSAVANDKAKKTQKKKRKVSKKSGAFNHDPKPLRRTSDGFVIYSEEDLGFGKQDAGGTALCPFDCSCCF